ncbi:unnamed protein product, partial [Ectocarpus sp. 8 AP-2014]
MVHSCDCACTDRCSLGDMEAAAACLSFRINLGNSAFGEEAGYLLLMAEEPSDDLSKPISLQKFLGAGLRSAQFETDGGKLLPNNPSGGGADYSAWGEAEMEIVSDYEYKIYFRIDTTGNGTPDTVYRTIVVENPDGAVDNDELLITETMSLPGHGSFTKYAHFAYTAGVGADDHTWTLTEGTDVAGMQTAIRVTVREEVWSGTERTDTITIKEPGGTVVSVSEEVYEEFAWGRELTSRTLDPSGAAIKQEWTYYDDSVNDGDNYGRKESFLSETGYWERYEYDSDGNVSETVRQYEDEELDLVDTMAVAAAANISVEYTEHDLTLTGASNEAVEVEKTVTKDRGTTVRSGYMIYRTTSSVTGCEEHWSVRCVTAAPEGVGTLQQIAMPDGQMMFYDRDIEDVDGEVRTTTVSGGYPNAGGTAIEYGTRATYVEDARGNMVSSLNERISQNDNSGNWFVVSLMKASDADAFGRPEQTDYYFGEEATEMEYGCCGGGDEETATDRAGIITITQDDSLGRPVAFVQASGTTGEIQSRVNYNAAGWAIDRGIDGDEDGDIERADDDDHVMSMTYDQAGRVTSATDPEGRKTYTTYRRVKADGSAFTVGTDTGAFYWETRRYGHDDEVPVSVSWTDSHGRSVMSFSGSCTWAGAEPTGTESLTERSRRTAVYDWADRTTESRSYFDLSGLSISLSSVGTEGTNYLVTGETEYDDLGRGFRRTDAAGNITEMVYEDGTGRLVAMKAGVSVGSLTVVSRQFYKLFESGDDEDDPTGDDRPWVTRSYSVKPELTTAPVEAASMGDYVYVETYEAFDVTGNALVNSHRGAVPEHGPWSKSTANAQGQAIYQRTYKEDDVTPLGDQTYILSQSEQTYITAATNNGQPEHSYAYEVDGSGAVTGDYIRTSFFYDDANRRVKTATDGRGYTKMAYDVYGRTERTVSGSSEGSNTSVYGANAFTDDIILTESVPTYDKSGLTLYTTSYSRNHDTPGSTTGLLSAASASSSRVSYNATWFDDNGRPTHSGTYGTNAFGAFTRPATAPEPNTSDNYLISKVEYDDAGRSYINTDNSGKKSRVFYDDMG